MDYASPISVKYGYVHKPTVIKSYVCVFVSLSVKAVHLELVSDLTIDANCDLSSENPSYAFLTSLRFVARQPFYIGCQRFQEDYLPSFVRIMAVYQYNTGDLKMHKMGFHVTGHICCEGSLQNMVNRNQFGQIMELTLLVQNKKFVNSMSSCSNK